MPTEHGSHAKQLLYPTWKHVGGRTPQRKRKRKNSGLTRTKKLTHWNVVVLFFCLRALRPCVARSAFNAPLVLAEWYPSAKEYQTLCLSVPHTPDDLWSRPSLFINFMLSDEPCKGAGSRGAARSWDSILFLTSLSARRKTFNAFLSTRDSHN